MHSFTSVLPIEEASQVAGARQQAQGLARTQGFSVEAYTRVALTVTEMGTNLVKHAGGGEILLRAYEDASEHWIEALSLDKGPGMSDVEACLRDGYSTSESGGTGLGAIRRLSQEFDIYSRPGKGTVLLARLNSSGMHRMRPALDIGVAQAPYRGLDICGDAWAAHRDAGGVLLLVADGLGHGPEAAQAARLATAFLDENQDANLVPLLEGIHGALRKSRGAAVAAAQFSVPDRNIRFAVLGNISGVIVSAEKAQHMVSQNGTAGVEVRRVQEFVYQWPRDAIAVFHSDGLGTKWDLNAYPGLAQRSAGVIAGVLYRDWSRRQDDVTVVVIKECV